MSNPHQHQQPPYSASGWNANTGYQNSNAHQFEQPHHGIPSSTFPQHERTGFKRSRDNSSPTDRSMQQSFKRLKVMEGDSHVGNLTNSSNMGPVHQSVSVDESSLADESTALSPTTDGHFPQHSAFVLNRHQQQQGHAHSCHQESHKRQRLYDNNAMLSTTPKSQPSGQGSFEVDYQPMNSLLGSLHRARRRQNHGTGQEAAVAVENQGMATTLPVQQHCQNGNNIQYHDPQQQQQQQQQQRQANNPGGIFMRPAKKKNISLRTSSNLY